MPYTQRLTWDGVALHAGGLPAIVVARLRAPAVEVRRGTVRRLADGMTVVVVDEHSALGRSPSAAFSPVDATTGAPVSAERLALTRSFASSRRRRRTARCRS